MTNTTNEALALELKQLIIDTLNLEDMTPADIATDTPLFIEGLGLDSIDALELGVALQKQYGVKLDPEEEETKKHFSNIASLCNLVTSKRTKG